MQKNYYKFLFISIYFSMFNFIFCQENKSNLKIDYSLEDVKNRSKEINFKRELVISSIIIKLLNDNFIDIYLQLPAVKEINSFSDSFNSNQYSQDLEMYADNMAKHLLDSHYWHLTNKPIEMLSIPEKEIIKKIMKEEIVQQLPNLKKIIKSYLKVRISPWNVKRRLKKIDKSINEKIEEENFDFKELKNQSDESIKEKELTNLSNNHSIYSQLTPIQETASEKIDEPNKEKDVISLNNINISQHLIPIQNSTSIDQEEPPKKPKLAWEKIINKEECKCCTIQ